MARRAYRERISERWNRGARSVQFSATFGQNDNTVEVNDLANPSIYEFTWGGGNLTIEGKQFGNNGLGNNINVELGLESAVTLNSNGSLTG